MPPDAYLQPTAEPVLYGPLTNAGLANGLLDARAAIRSCNVDKAAVRQWSLTVKEQHATK